MAISALLSISKANWYVNWLTKAIFIGCYSLKEKLHSSDRICKINKKALAYLNGKSCRTWNSNFPPKYVLYASIISIHLFSVYPCCLIKWFLNIQEKCSGNTATCFYIFKEKLNAIKSQKLGIVYLMKYNWSEKTRSIRKPANHICILTLITSWLPTSMEWSE